MAAYRLQPPTGLTYLSGLSIGPRIVRKSTSRHEKKKSIIIELDRVHHDALTIILQFMSAFSTLSDSEQYDTKLDILLIRRSLFAKHRTEGGSRTGVSAYGVHPGSSCLPELESWSFSGDLQRGGYTPYPRARLQPYGV